MEAKLKPSNRWDTTLAFSGREYVKSEFRPVPEWAEAAALADERFEVRQPAVKVAIVAPAPAVTVIPIEPEAYLFEEDETAEIIPPELEAELKEELPPTPAVATKKSTRKHKAKIHEPEA